MFIWISVIVCVFLCDSVIFRFSPKIDIQKSVFNLHPFQSFNIDSPIEYEANSAQQFERLFLRSFTKFAPVKQFAL